MHDPKYDLTEQEKWECVARWLNALYSSYTSGTDMIGDDEKTLSIHDALYNKDCVLMPCSVCPLYKSKCTNVILPPQYWWKVIEKFTGKDTIIDITLTDFIWEATNTRSSEHKENQSPDNNPSSSESI